MRYDCLTGQPTTTAPSTRSATDADGVCPVAFAAAATARGDIVLARSLLPKPPAPALTASPPLFFPFLPAWRDTYLPPSN